MCQVPSPGSPGRYTAGPFRQRSLQPAPRLPSFIPPGHKIAARTGCAHGKSTGGIQSGTGKGLTVYGKEFPEPPGRWPGSPGTARYRVERPEHRDHPMRREPVDTGLHLCISLAKPYDNIGKDPALTEQFHGPVEDPPQAVVVKTRAHLCKEIRGGRLDIEFNLCHTESMELIRGLVGRVDGYTNRQAKELQVIDDLTDIGLLLPDALQDTARERYSADPVPDRFDEIHDLLYGFAFPGEPGDRAVATGEDAALRDRYECLVRAVKPRLEEPARNLPVIKKEIGDPAPPVGNLNRGRRVDCKLDPVAAHGKEDRAFSSCTRACRGFCKVILCWFAAEPGRPGLEQPGLQFFPLHSSSASSYRVKNGKAATAPVIPRPFIRMRRLGSLRFCTRSGVTSPRFTSFAYSMSSSDKEKPV